ncbi:uncharacterized protein CELE_H03A11.13 [Caenorhabditis elegans]|uniref:Uncharacterized protein n=1 Tax=Caenorhabditis elegans TaxID=6239 RepID=A0A2K5AU24_CAEEL|nr:Uncharacterized protein CELE_H03A11.13 [Caenorhabditis elegans]SPC48671.1 Uncharacterized protein CELE_H03A11.13 [Caenorhabditis elegans]|eukprot:NP_001348810.1 Uncharacterized protein CELE_H03A11.13 [Caenorhabditis elegans]
MKLKPAKSKK